MARIYHISQAAKMINRSKITIQRWIKEGLLEPQRDDRGWIIFTEQDIKHLERIKQHKRDIMISGVGKGAEE